MKKQETIKTIGNIKVYCFYNLGKIYKKSFYRIDIFKINYIMLLVNNNTLHFERDENE